MVRLYLVVCWLVHRLRIHKVVERRVGGQHRVETVIRPPKARQNNKKALGGGPVASMLDYWEARKKVIERALLLESILVTATTITLIFMFLVIAIKIFGR